jgi:hypothetical protein|tara:strand:- start:61 stop:402 length:342 start_codon:yes stop_codon:yes gene_type:complete
MALTINSDSITLDLKWTDGNNSMGADVTITERDVKVLLNDLQSVESWLIGALVGKINNCKKRLLAEHRAAYFADAAVNTDDEIIAAVFAADGYKTRAERDAEEAAGPTAKSGL